MVFPFSRDLTYTFGCYYRISFKDPMVNVRKVSGLHYDLVHRLHYEVCGLHYDLVQS